MFQGLNDSELLAFAVSHYRNDIRMPVDMAMELSLRGITPAVYANAVTFVEEVEAWDSAYDMAVKNVDEVLDEIAIGGTD